MLNNFQLVNNNIIQINENLQSIIIYIIKQKVKLEHQNEIIEKRNEFLSLLNIILNINTFILSFVSYNSNLILISYVIIGITFICSMYNIFIKVFNLNKKKYKYKSYLNDCDEALKEYKDYISKKSELYNENIELNENIQLNDELSIYNNISNNVSNNISIQNISDKTVFKKQVPSIFKILNGYEKILKIKSKYDNNNIKYNNISTSSKEIINKIDIIINNIENNQLIDEDIINKKIENKMDTMKTIKCENYQNENEINVKKSSIVLNTNKFKDCKKRMSLMDDMLVINLKNEFVIKELNESSYEIQKNQEIQEIQEIKNNNNYEISINNDEISIILDEKKINNLK